MRLVFEFSSWLDAQNHSGVTTNDVGMFSATTARKTGIKFYFLIFNACCKMTRKVYVQKRNVVGVDSELCMSFVKTLVANWSSWLFEFRSEILRLYG